jgi:TetR/AcrR family transcriptional regulator, repressor of fatR-cypB operon
VVWFRLDKASWNEYSFRVGDKAQDILDAALELFAERGFYGTTVPEIALKAKVGAGTIYRHFPSKEAIGNALYQQWKKKLAVTLTVPLHEPAPVQLEHFVHCVLDFARQHPRAFKFLELHHHMAYLDETSRAIEKLTLAPAYAFFEYHSKAKTTRDAPSNLLGAIVWGCLVGLVRAAEAGYVKLDAETEKTTTQALWKAISAA